MPSSSVSEHVVPHTFATPLGSNGFEQVLLEHVEISTIDTAAVEVGIARIADAIGVRVALIAVGL